MNKVAIFGMMILILALGILGGVVIATRFAATTQASVILASVSFLVGYLLGLGMFALIHQSKGRNK